MTERNLTDSDVSAIVDKLKEEIARDLYAEAGKGLWQWARKTIQVRRCGGFRMTTDSLDYLSAS